MTMRVFSMFPARNGNERAMFVGFTGKARFLEIGVEVISGDRYHVYHGMITTKEYRKMHVTDE